MKYTQHKPNIVNSSGRALPMNARGKTTSARLAKPVYCRLVPPAGRFPGGNMTAFFRFLVELGADLGRQSGRRIAPGLFASG